MKSTDIKDYLTQIEHRGVKVSTLLHNESIDRLIEDPKGVYNVKVGYIPKAYEHRPDLISDLFYDSVEPHWILMLINNMTDPFEDFNPNQQIVIPELF